MAYHILQENGPRPVSFDPGGGWQLQDGPGWSLHDGGPGWFAELQGGEGGWLFGPPEGNGGTPFLDLVWAVVVQ